MPLTAVEDLGFSEESINYPIKEALPLLAMEGLKGFAQCSSLSVGLEVALAVEVSQERSCTVLRNSTAD